MTEDLFVDAAALDERALTRKLRGGEEKRLDEMLLELLRRRFEVREAGSLKGWY